MLVTIGYRYAGSPAVEGTPAFTDVPAGEWYTDAVLWAEQLGIVQGYGDGRFGTGDPVSRQELAVILHRFAVKQGGFDLDEADLDGFADAGEIAEWALPAMKWAVAQGLIPGVSDTELAPMRSTSRAEVATILMRFAGLAE